MVVSSNALIRKSNTFEKGQPVPIITLLDFEVYRILFWLILYAALDFYIILLVMYFFSRW